VNARWSALAILAFGLIFAGLGVFVVRPSVPDGWVTTEGVVVGHVASRDSESTTYAPVVEYTDAAGATHRTRSNTYTSGSLVDKVGSRIQVAYDPARPGQARIIGGTASWVWLLVVGFGLLFTLVGTAVFIRDARGPVPVPSAQFQPSGRLLGASAYRFERSAGRQLLDLLGTPIGALVFLAVAFFLGRLSFEGGGIGALFGAVVFAAFGSLMAAGGATALRRGLDRTVIEVGRDAVWLSAGGRFGWHELAEVRHETFLGAGGDRPVAYRRLGFVPKVSFARAESPVDRTLRLCLCQHLLPLRHAARRPSIDRLRTVRGPRLRGGLVLRRAPRARPHVPPDRGRQRRAPRRS
jgi:hypothetical protein